MTQGIVSLIHDGRTLAKCVAGCDGFNACELAAEIRRMQSSGNSFSVQSVYDAARRMGFGCEECLVVLGPNPSEVLFKGGDELSGSYRETFDDPKWNPRWTHGTAAYVELVEVAPHFSPR